MSERREDDLATLAWPGFVDILSAVVIMFVFFLMIVSTSLYFHTIIYKSKILHQSEIQIKSSIQQDNKKDLKKEIKRLSAKNKELQEQLEGNGISHGEQLEESDEQAFDLSKDKMTLTIYFGVSSITVVDQTKEEIEMFFDTHKSKLLTGKYIVHVEVGKSQNAATKSIAREVALARLFNIRNEILKIEELPRNIIKANVIDSVKINDTYNWAKLTVKRKTND